MEGTLRLRVVRILENGDTEIRAAYEKGSVQLGEAKSSITKVAPVTFQVSKNGLIRDEERVFKSAGEVKVTRPIDGGTESTTVNVYQSALDAIFIELPDRELKVGDTWTPATEESGPAGAIGGTTKLVEANAVSATLVTTGKQSDTEQMQSTEDGSAGQLTTTATMNVKNVFSIEKGRKMSSGQLSLASRNLNEGHYTEHKRCRDTGQTEIEHHNRD